MTSNLFWEKYPVGTDGFVCLVDVMGDDQAIVQAARVSYRNDTRDEESTYSMADDRNLIRYMMRHHHGTPFEMCELKFLVRVPMDTWRQWIRHRTANVNETSTRYAPAIDSMEKARVWRSQSTTNKQGSADPLLFLTDCELLSKREAEFQEYAQTIYKQRLAMGVAREQARKDLPLSTYTEAYWKIDLRNLFNFLFLRMDSHAQQEIREYANAIASIVEHLFPIAWEAFVDYRLSAMTLSLTEIEAVQTMSLSHITNKREREECQAKLKRLRIPLRAE